jgi:hypothetical protein
MKNLNWRQWLLILAFLLVVAFTAFFAVRTVRRAVYWHQHRDEPIRGWMTVGYVAHSYRVPPHVLYAALGLPGKPDRRPLRAIARDQKRPVSEVIADLQRAIEQYRSQYSAPHSPPAEKGRSP